MLADALENLEAYSKNLDYPYAILVCGCGFLFVLLLDKVLLREENVADESGGRPIYPFMLTLVLSVHSVIAGATLGLEKSLVSSLVIFIAIISHKGCAAFALGVSLREAGFPRPRMIGIIALFSCMTPLGIILGSLFSTMLKGKAAYGVEAIFDGLAAGTFLYIAILDIMVEVFHESENRWNHFILMALGFAIMALIAVWT
jgi:zinc transporter 1/2/3